MRRGRPRPQGTTPSYLYTSSSWKTDYGEDIKKSFQACTLLHHTTIFSSINPVRIRAYLLRLLPVFCNGLLNVGEACTTRVSSNTARHTPSEAEHKRCERPTSFPTIKFETTSLFKPRASYTNPGTQTHSHTDTDTNTSTHTEAHIITPRRRASLSQYVVFQQKCRFYITPFSNKKAKTKRAGSRKNEKVISTADTAKCTHTQSAAEEPFTLSIAIGRNEQARTETETREFVIATPVANIASSSNACYNWA